MTLTCEVAVDAHAVVGEGPLWDDKKSMLYWTDIVGRRFHAYDPSTGSDTSVEMPEDLGCMRLTTGDSLICGMYHGIALLQPGSSDPRFLLNPEENKPNTRFNDGKVGPDGAYYAGTMDYDITPEAGGFYRIAPDLTFTTLIDGVTISNGLDWSPDEKTLYFIDSGRLEVRAYDFDKETGTISNERVAITVDDVLEGEIEDNIRCVSISPGTIDTPLVRIAAETFEGRDPEELWREWAAHHPLNRLGTPEEVAATVFFLASKGAGFMTGSDVLIDGGIRCELYA